MNILAVRIDLIIRKRRREMERERVTKAVQQSQQGKLRCINLAQLRFLTITFYVQNFHRPFFHTMY